MMSHRAHRRELGLHQEELFGEREDIVDHRRAKETKLIENKRIDGEEVKVEPKVTG